jgi:hypothetical protein
MFKNILLLVACVQLTILLQAQVVDNYWYTGYEKVTGPPWGPTTLDFRNNNPSIYFDTARSMNFDFAEASISDSASSILFYTNGVWISNAQHDTMLNGSGINPSTYTTQQAIFLGVGTGLRITGSSLILPFPDHQDQYMLIHETADDIYYPYPSFLYYSIIDSSN